MGLLNKLWSQADFWDKEENKRQAQAAAKPMPARAPQPQQNVIQRAAPTGLRASLGVAVATLPGATPAISAYKLLNSTKPGKAILAGGKRSVIGTGQALTGLYDLATPGTGTNRISKTLDQQAKQVDQSVKDQRLNPILYKGGQLGGDIATGMGAGGAAKWAGRGLVKAAPVLRNVPKAVSAVETGVTKAVAPMASKNFGGRIVAKTVQNVANPKYQGVNALYTAQQTGKDASQGRQITRQRVATDAAIGGLAFPAAGAIAGQTAKAAAAPVVNKLKSAHLIRPTGLSDSEVAHLNRFVENRGTNGMTEDVYSKGVAAAQKAGLSHYDVSAMDRVIGDHMTYNSRQIARKEALQKMKPKPLNEGGYIAGPLALDFKKAQKKGLVFDGVDGKPRFEVDDSGARLKKDLFTDEKLENILDHPELYRQYPELKNLRVVSQNEFKNTPTNASYDRGANAIAVNPEHMRKGDDFKSTLLHEVQHAIQNKEAFANGGSTESAMGALLVKRDASRKALQEFFAKHRDAKGNVPDQHKAELKRLQDENRKLIDIEAMSRHTDGRHAYDRLAGEAEARAVQARMNMPMSERYVTDPVVNSKTGETLSQSVKKLEGYGWSKADIEKYKKTVLGGNTKMVAPEGALDSLNPTGGLYVDYTPAQRAKAPLADNMTTLDKTLGGKPDDIVTIYRGAPKNQKEIVAGDFVTLDKQAAQNYAGEGHVIAKQVRKGDLLDELDSPSKGDETLYRPNADKESRVARKSVATQEVPKPRSTFYDSLDVPKQDLIIRNDGGKAMSLQSPEDEINVINRRKIAQNIKDRFSTPLGEGGYVRIPGSNQTHDPLNNKIAATQLYKAAQRAGKAESNPRQLNQANLSSQPQLPAAQLKRIVPDNMTHNTPRSGQLSLADHNIPPQGQLSDRLAQPAHHTPEGHTPYNNDTPFDANRYVKEQTKLQEKARKAEFGSTGEKLGAIRQDFSTKMIDSFTPIENALKQAQKVAEIAPENNVTYQIDRVIRSNGIADTFIKDNGLDRIIQNVPNTKEFDQYLIAKHAKELGKDITTGRNATKDAALVQALDEKYAPFAKELYGYNQKLLDTAVNYGLISKEAATSLKEKYPEYVPFNRIFADGEVTLPAGVGKGKASISQQNVVKGIKGSKRQIESPLSSIIDKTQAVIEQGERNKAAQMISSYKDIPGNPFDLKEISSKETIGQRHTISFLDNGKKRTFETTKEISDAAKNMTQQQIGLIGQVLAAPARVLRLGATGVNIGFTASNVIKDIIGAAVNSRNALSSSPLNLAAMGKALAAALRHDGKYYQELMREGVAGTSFDLARNSARLNVKEIRSQKNLGTRALHNANPLRWVRTLENTIGRSEDFGRALQYYGNKAAFEKKMSPERAKILAADQARFNSTNFARAGTYGRVINSVVPYSNAAIQGARIGARRIKERPVATIGKMVATIGAPSAFIALNNYGDPEKRKVMENIPAYEREGNIIIVGDNPVFNEKTGRWDGVTKIPVPPQFKALHDSIQRGVYSAMTGEKFDVGKTIGDTSENLTTVNVNGGSGMLKTASTYTPQTAKLFFEPMFNRNMFTGQQIVPDAMKNIDAKNQHTKSTSLTAKNIGQALNVSPMQIDNFVRTSMAGSGQNLIRLSDEALAKTGKGTKEDVRGQGLKESITDRFIGSKGQSDATLYYKSFEDAAKANKLNGRDYNQLKTLLSKETDANGIPVAKDEKDKMTANAIYANSPVLAKTRADAAKMFAKQTGKGYDPLYDLPIDKQVIFYKSQGLPKNSAEQRNIFEKNKWVADLKKNRSEYFKTVDMNKASASGMVPYPEPSQQVQDLLDQYTGLTDSKVRVQFMKDHPEVGQHFGNIAKYTNDVRQAQGFDPLRTYTQPSARVQQLLDTMGSKAYRDPEVAAWSQANAVYNATKDAALAQIQGNDLSSKALGAFNSIAKYDMVKNPDGTYSLRYGDPQGGGQNIAQPGAFAVGGFSSFGKRGRKGRKMGLSNPTYSSANRKMQSALKSTRTKA